MAINYAPVMQLTSRALSQQKKSQGSGNMWGAIAAGALSAGTGLVGSIINAKLQQDNLDYQKSVQQEEWNREDTAYQRTVADARAAGISPLAAIGNPNSSSVVQTTAPQIDTSGIQNGIVLGAQHYLQSQELKAQQLRDANQTALQTYATMAQIRQKDQELALQQQGFWNTVREGNRNFTSRIRELMSNSASSSAALAETKRHNLAAEKTAADQVSKTSAMLDKQMEEISKNIELMNHNLEYGRNNGLPIGTAKSSSSSTSGGLGINLGNGKGINLNFGHSSSDNESIRSLVVGFIPQNKGELLDSVQAKLSDPSITDVKQFIKALKSDGKGPFGSYGDTGKQLYDAFKRANPTVNISKNDFIDLYLSEVYNNFHNGD